MLGLNFRKELENLINAHSMENGSDTPDYILAHYLHTCLDAFDSAVKERTRWYSKATKEGNFRTGVDDNR
jgi:hypothetical protein